MILIFIIHLRVIRVFSLRIIRIAGPFSPSATSTPALYTLSKTIALTVILALK
jgi:hypothetical protein